jgi:hypothetical protein
MISTACGCDAGSYSKDPGASRQIQEVAMNNSSPALQRRSILAALAGAPAVAVLAGTPGALAATSQGEAAIHKIRTLTQKVGDVEVYYREAGAADAPVILLLHGFPTSGHMFRDLIPELSDRYRVIAPDLPGFGLTKARPVDSSLTISTTSRRSSAASSTRSASSAMPFTSSTMVRRPDYAWRWRARNG